MPDRDHTPSMPDESVVLHRDALDAVRDIVLIVSATGLIVDGNQAAEHAYGLTRDQLLSKSIRELRDPASRASVGAQLGQAREAGITFETLHVRADGTTFPVEVSSSPFSHGPEGCVISVVRDISRRRELEEMRARLVEQLTTANARLDGALTLLSSAVGAPDLDTLLQRSVAALAAVMHTDASAFLVRDASQLIVRAQQGAKDWAAVGTTIRLDEGFSGDVVLAEGPVHIPDLAVAVGPYDHLIGHGMRSLLGVPVRIEGELFGVLQCAWRQPRDVDETERSMVQLAADRIALAIKREREFEAEHHIAETLQEAMLLMPPSVRGLEFAHLYRSATLSARVGGDFFDIFELSDDRVGIIVGDVSGKGLEAAVLTSIIKDTIRAYAHDAVSPAAVIAKANVVLGGASKAPAFASVFFAVVDTVTGSMTHCCAGHPPAVVLGTDGEVRLLETGSPVIGALPELMYHDAETTLQPGESVLLYTDGVTEARDPQGAFFGEERLLEAVHQAVGGDVEGITTAVFDAVLEFARKRLTDDIALLAFRLAP